MAGRGRSSVPRVALRSVGSGRRRNGSVSRPGMASSNHALGSPPKVIRSVRSAAALPAGDGLKCLRAPCRRWRPGRVWQGRPLPGARVNAVAHNGSSAGVSGPPGNGRWRTVCAPPPCRPAVARGPGMASATPEWDAASAPWAVACLMHRDPGLVRAVPAGGCRGVAGTASHEDGPGAAGFAALGGCSRRAGRMPAHGAASDRSGCGRVSGTAVCACCRLLMLPTVVAARRGTTGAGSPACSAPGQAARPLVRLHRRGKGCPRPPALPTQLVQGLPPERLRACERVARPAIRRRPASGQRRPSRIDTDRNSPGPNAKGTITSAGRSRRRHWIVPGRLCIRHWWCKACRVRTSSRLPGVTSPPAVRVLPATGGPAV